MKFSQEAGERQQDDGVKGIEMEGDFEGEMEDVPPNNESDQDDQGDEERLQQEMGDTGDAGETVDERLWGPEDKPEETQQGPETKEKDSTVQVRGSYHPSLSNPLGKRRPSQLSFSNSCVSSACARGHAQS